MVYDNLKNDGCEENFTAIYEKAKFYATAGVIVGIATAGVLASFISKEASGFIRESNVVLASIIFLVLFANIGGYLDEFDALIINDFRLSHLWVRVILTVRFAFVGLGDILAPMVKKRISSNRQIFLLFGMSCILLSIFAAIWNQYAIAIFGLSFTAMATAAILLVDALQKEIKEEGRATILSLLRRRPNCSDDLFQPALCAAGRDIYLATGLLYHIRLWVCWRGRLLPAVETAQGQILNGNNPNFSRKTLTHSSGYVKLTEYVSGRALPAFVWMRK